MGGGRGGALGGDGAGTAFSSGARVPGALAGIAGPSSQKEIDSKVAEASKRTPQQNRDTVLGGGGRGTGGTGTGPTAAPSDVKPPPGPTTPPEQTNFLDSLFGYDSIEARRAAYNNNPNRPGYDTSDMGIPISLTPTEVMMGSSQTVPDPVLATGLGLVGMMASGIGPAMAATRAIQAATGMTGGPAPGGQQDNLTANPRTDSGPDSSATMSGAKRAGVAPNDQSQSNGLNTDTSPAAPVVNPELARILAEQRRIAAARQTVLTGDVGAAQTTRKTLLGV